MTKVGRDVFVRVFSTDHCGGEDGVGGGQASRDHEGREEVEARDEGEYERCGDEPALLTLCIHTTSVSYSSFRMSLGGREDAPRP